MDFRLQLDINMSGDKAAQRVVESITKRAQTTLLDRLTKEIQAQIKARINVLKRAPDGTAWPARMHQYPHPMLVKTKRMLRGVDRIRQGDTRIIAITAPYAGYQHFGTKKIKARPFVGLSDGDMQSLEKILKQWFDEQ